MTAESPAEYYGTAPQAPPMAPQTEEAIPAENGYDVDNIKGEFSYRSNDSLMMTSAIEEREMKIIKTWTISAQTEEYDTFLNELSMKISSLSGYLESNTTED